MQKKRQKCTPSLVFKNSTRQCWTLKRRKEKYQESAYRKWQIFPDFQIVSSAQELGVFRPQKVPSFKFKISTKIVNNMMNLGMFTKSTFNNTN